MKWEEALRPLMAWRWPLQLPGICWKRIAATRLFATHYFELTRLAEEFPQAANVHLDAVEHKHHIVFLHAINEGPASQSYGLQVAALAGVPEPVIKTARKYLVKLEQESVSRQTVAANCSGIYFRKKRQCHGNRQKTRKSRMTRSEHPALALLRAIVPDELSPKQALEELYVLKKQQESNSVLIATI